MPTSNGAAYIRLTTLTAWADGAQVVPPTRLDGATRNARREQATILLLDAGAAPVGQWEREGHTGAHDRLSIQF